MVVRIAGINLPENKKTEIALTYIFGLGRSTARKIIEKAGVDLDSKLKDLTEQEVDKLRHIIEKEYKIEGDLKRIIGGDIKRLKEINSYRGIRHKLNLPARGQRTKTNARTKRGRRVTVGSGRKPAGMKT